MLVCMNLNEVLYLRLNILKKEKQVLKPGRCRGVLFTVRLSLIQKFFLNAGIISEVWV